MQHFLNSLVYQQPSLGSHKKNNSGLPKAQVGAMSLQPELKQGINEKTSLCHYTRGHHNEDIMRSTGFHRTQGMRGCHNNGDITVECHNEVSTCRGVPNNLLWVFTPIRHERDRQEAEGKAKREGGGTYLGRWRWGEEVEDGRVKKKDEEERLKGQSAVIRMWWPV